MAGRTNVAMILADPDATPKEKYDALIATGWTEASAATAAHYTPTAPAAGSAAAATAAPAAAAAKSAADAARAAGEAAKVATDAASAAVPAAKAATAAATPAPAPTMRGYPVPAGTAPAPAAAPSAPAQPAVPGTLVTTSPAAAAAAYRAGILTTEGTAVPLATPPAGAPPPGKEWVRGTAGYYLADKKADVVSGAAPGAAPAPEGDSFQRHYTAMGEAVEEDYRDFATFLRGLADKGELTGADGKPLPMYSAERIAKLTLPELKKLANDNPRYARMFFKEPSAETVAALEGTGRTGVGPRSGMVELPPLPAGKDPVAAAATSAVAAAKPDAPPAVQEAEAAKLVKKADDPSFQDQVKKISKDWGISILEALQAGMLGYIGGYSGNWQKSAYQLRMEREEREKASEEERAARREEMAAQDKRLMMQLENAAAQAELDRVANALALDKQLSMQEKIARLQAAQRKAGVAVSADAAAAELLGY